MAEFGAQDALNFFAACPFACICVGSDGRIAAGNAAAVALSGGAGPLEGVDIADILPEWLVVQPATAPGFRREMSLVRSDGSKLSVEVSMVRLGGGRTSSIGLVLRDLGREKMIAALQTELQRQSERALLEAGAANKRLEFVIDMLPQAACVFDAHDRYVLWNKKYTELYPEIADQLRPGVSFEEILRKSVGSGKMPEIIGDREAWFAARMKRQRLPMSQEEQQLQDGRWVLHDDRRTPDGGAIGMRIDISELKRREQASRLLFDANPMPMMLCDAATLEMLSVNAAAITLYGYGPGDLLGRAVSVLSVPEETALFAQELMSVRDDREARTIWRQRTASGDERSVMIYVRILTEGLKQQLLLTIADVTDRIRAEAHANHLAHHDALTGLPNRMHFLSALEKALAQRDPAAQVAVHYLDLDGFKPVNDRLGHAAGDALLSDVGQRLRTVVGTTALTARLGGDEFAILQPIDALAPAVVAQRCIEAIGRPFVLQGTRVTIGISVGVAVSPFAGIDPDGLMRAADAALYRAKAAGKNTWRENETAIL